MSKLGKWKELSLARKNSGMSVQDLAVKLGVAVNTIYRWENGDMRPHMIFVSKLSRMLGVELTRLEIAKNNNPKKRRGA